MKLIVASPFRSSITPILASLLIVSGCASSSQIAKLDYPPMPKNERLNPDWRAPDEKVLGSQSGDVDGAIRVLETEIRKQNHQWHMELQFVVHYDEK